tara:strand:+ start:576 stop:1289 length:714 start_codon:yes stop_codon:yes gene_type:complete
MDEILGLIPARGGSKGIKKKNIKILGGIPLIAHTINTALKINFSKLIVSTDDTEIAAVAEKYGAEVPFIRPSHLSNDTATSFSLIEHAVKFFIEKNISFKAVCLLQPTYPFRTKKLINDCIKKLSDKRFDSIVSVLKIPDTYNPHWVFKLNNRTNMIEKLNISNNNITRRQDLPKYFHRDGAVYLSRISNILTHKSIYGKNIGYVISDKSRYVNIDTMEDWNKAELMYKMLCISKNK